MLDGEGGICNYGLTCLYRLGEGDRRWCGDMFGDCDSHGAVASMGSSGMLQWMFGGLFSSVLYLRRLTGCSIPGDGFVLGDFSK